MNGRHCDRLHRDHTRQCRHRRFPDTRAEPRLDPLPMMRGIPKPSTSSEGTASISLIPQHPRTSPASRRLGSAPHGAPDESPTTIAGQHFCKGSGDLAKCASALTTVRTGYSTLRHGHAWRRYETPAIRSRQSMISWWSALAMTRSVVDLDVSRLSRGPRHSHRRQPRQAEDRSAERYAGCIRTLRYGTRSSTR
jgi:hypothetical protein